MFDNSQKKADLYLAQMKDSLSAPAVLKAQLASLKSACIVSNVFAYEGVSDKTVYYHWIVRLKPELGYEPFVCKNKAQLLQLFDLLQRDRTGLGKGVYFFVDRDFDDLRGRKPSSAVFLTEKYSVENYLVNIEVLEELLKNELHCHGAPGVRKRVTELFERVYDQFLKETTEINFRIFIARRLGIRQIGDLPQRISLLADIQFEFVGAGRGVLREMVALDREPTEAEVAVCREEFIALDPRSRYRGKFVLHFFQKWLSLLVDDRNATESTYFRELPQPELVAGNSFSFDLLAAKSKPPLSLQRFLALVGQDAVAEDPTMAATNAV